MSAIGRRGSLARVVFASSVGTMIEYYDFFIFASLAGVLSATFYPSDNPTIAFLSTMATFAIGLAIRPFGSLLFGRLGDAVGRKTTFLVTLVMMGGSTAAMGILPGYRSIGYAAPALLLVLRLVQGLAVGGEYAGAATYVGEHAPENRRGFYTSFIQAMPTLGILAANFAVLETRRVFGGAVFDRWAWRLPFLVSVVLVGISYYVRSRLAESPIFAALKRAGRTSLSPVRDAFGTWERWRLSLIVVFGLGAGQAVLAITSQVYVLFFLERVVHVPSEASYAALSIALVLCVPVIIGAGALSDRLGRKPLMTAGNLLGALSLYPLYRAISHYASPLNPTMLAIILFLQMVPLAIVYGPFAAFLVEAFPARIRYTSISVPYHFANGWFGGFLPLIASAIVARTGNAYAWLSYPIGVTVMTFVVGSVFVTDRYRLRLSEEVDASAPGDLDLAAAAP